MERLTRTMRILTLLALMVIGAGQAWARGGYGKIFYEHHSSDGGGLMCFASADEASAYTTKVLFYDQDANNSNKLTFYPSKATLIDGTENTLTNGTVYILAKPAFGYTGLGANITAEISGGSGAAQARRRAPSDDNPGVGQTIEVTPVNGHPGVYQFTMPDDGSNVTLSATFTALTKATVNYIDPTKTGSAQNCTHEAYVLDGTEFYLGTSDTETWYVCNADLTYNHYLSLYGDVHLILTDGKTMTINDANNQNAIDGNNDNTYLTIYGQSGATGMLNATEEGQNGTLLSDGITAWCITINGGKVSAKGRYGIYASFNFIVNGGEVTASNSNTTGSAIVATSVVINGGKVTAHPYNDGAGTGINASGDITINGGQVTVASAGNDNYGIHSTAGNITLGWRSVDDFINVSSYYVAKGTVKIAEGQYFTYEGNTGGLLSGTLDEDQITAIAGQKLTPVGHKVTVPAGQYMTYFSPDALTLGTEQTGAALYTITGVGTDAVTLSDALTVASKETPLLVYNGATTDKDIFLYITAEPTTKTAHADEFKGTATAKEFSADDMKDKQCYVLAGGKMFVRVDGTGTIAANKCWLEFDNTNSNANAARQLNIGFGDGDPTAVANSSLFTLHSSLSEWYDLQGRKLEGKPKRKGVYIRNGKKIAQSRRER